MSEAPLYENLHHTRSLQSLEICSRRIPDNYSTQEFPGVHTQSVDFGPFIKSQAARMRSHFGPYVIQNWSRLPTKIRDAENIVVHRVDGGQDGDNHGLSSSTVVLGGGSLLFIRSTPPEGGRGE